jgi:hypothetical protein
MKKIFASLCLITTLLWQPASLSARDSFPLEILYVQTDKQNYVTGENIWFRAYLVNSQTHVQDTLSRYVYAELINSQHEVVNRVMIRHENGVFAGHIPVTEELEAGSYILRFFTRHLENFGEEYFFQRVIHIITPQSLEKSQTVAETIQNDDFTVTFHPEGGDIPIGTYTRIAFKALNSSGLGEDIRGVIVSENGDTITHIQSSHLGMGAFIFTANRNERFFAIARNAAGVEKQFELPRAHEDAISLQIFRQRGNVIVSLSHNNRRLPQILHLTLQNRGDIIYSERWDNDNEVVVIPENDLPTGVIGIILSDSRGVPISKRQIFNTNRTETVNTTFTTDRETYGTRERVNATVTVTNNENRPLNANFSISVIDNDIAHYDASVNILSTLLLTSDLRGHIENPAYYFMPENENAKNHLDLVMLTNGWSRFEVSRIYQEEVFTFETSQSITGTLRGSFLRRGANQPVLLIVPEFGFFEEIYTDDEGRFRLEGFEFPEGTEFLVQGRTGTETFVDKELFPAINNFFIPTRTNDVLAFDDEQIENIRWFMPDDGIWSIELDEFVVTEQRRRERDPHFLVSQFVPTRGREELERLRAPDMFMLLQMAFPRMNFGSRASNFIIGEDAFAGPLIMVDGARMRMQDLIGFPVHGIESVYSLGGWNFIITTSSLRPEGSIPTNVIMITPLGYQITREFFSPAYTFPEQRASENADLRTTIFWNPSVTTGENGSANLHFYTSDHVGNYVVIIEGITDEGGIVHTISHFTDLNISIK